MSTDALAGVWAEPADYDALARHFQAANAALLSHHAPAGGRALDAGCGTGLLAEALLRRGVEHVTAFDPSPAMVEAARRRLGGDRARVSTARLEDFGTAERFDVVASSAMLTWLYPRLVEALARLASFARPGGAVLVATAGRCEGSDAYDLAQERLRALAGFAPPPVPFFLRRAGIDDLRAAARQAGLDVGDAFLLEREQRMDARAWARWLLASGAPWQAAPGDPAGQAEERLAAATGGAEVRVRHWTAFAVCRRGER